VEVQRLTLVVLESSETITIQVARTDVLFKSTLAVLLEDLKKSPGFFW
jgi:hypothetical protein